MGLRGLIGEADPFLKPQTCPEGILFEALLRLYPMLFELGIRCGVALAVNVL